MVFFGLSAKLLFQLQFSRFSASSLYADSLLFNIRPITVVSSANLIKMLVSWTGLQSCVKRECKRGLSRQPCGAPVLSIITVEKCLPMRTDCSLQMRNSKIVDVKLM